MEAILQVQWASSLLHPDLFPDLKIETKLKEFYKNYLSYELTDSEVASSWPLRNRNSLNVSRPGLPAGRR